MDFLPNPGGVHHMFGSIFRRAFFYLAAGVCFLACVAVGPADQGGQGVMAKKTIAEVLREHSGRLMSIPGVVGTAEGLKDGIPCIKVLVVQKTPELERKIPRALDGYPVEIVETGEIRAYPKK